MSTSLLRHPPAEQLLARQLARAQQLVHACQSAASCPGALSPLVVQQQAVVVAAAVVVVWEVSQARRR